MVFSDIHQLLHGALVWLVILLVGGTMILLYVFYRLFEGDFFRAD